MSLLAQVFSDIRKLTTRNSPDTNETLSRHYRECTPSEGWHSFRKILSVWQKIALLFAHVRKMSYLCSVFWCSMREIVIVIGMVALAVVLLAVGVILRKDHRFRSEHISENRRMREHNIHCATAQDREARKRRKMDINKL